MIIQCDLLNDMQPSLTCVESKGLTAAVLNTSKMFEEIGDLYAKQVNNFISFVVHYMFDMRYECLQCFDTVGGASGRASGL